MGKEEQKQAGSVSKQMGPERAAGSVYGVCRASWEQCVGPVCHSTGSLQKLIPRGSMQGQSVPAEADIPGEACKDNQSRRQGKERAKHHLPVEEPKNLPWKRGKEP